MVKKTIGDIEVTGKRVLVRVDFNVPLDPKTGTITDDSRIRATLPTIKYLVERKAKVILGSHLGRPDGKVMEELRMAPVAQRLSRLLNLSVLTAPDSIGVEVEKVVGQMKEGDVLLLENLRFHKKEEENNPSFAQNLARLADIYVNDAFGTAHRAHASVVGVAKYLPAVAGFLMERELTVLGKILGSPARPFASLIGGAKVSDKLGLLENIGERVDSLLIGGGMAATFLKAKGYEVGRSPVEDDKLEVAQNLMAKATKKEITLLLPEDVMVAEELKAKAPAQVIPVTKIARSQYIVDIGPQTIELFSNALKKCRTILWNGPMGIYEIDEFALGTKAIARLLAELPVTTIVGGGSTAEVVEEMGLTDKMTHVSTGGGATLKFLEGKVLPGVAVLLDKE